MSETLPLTGERTAPGIPSENYWFQRHVAAYRFAARLLTGTVVDAGCGEGYGSAILASSAAKVISLDVDLPTLSRAASRYRSAEFAVADLHRVPLADSSVDWIVCLQVIEHLENAHTFVREAARVLGPGGTLIVSTPNRLTFPSGLNPFHSHEHDASELRELLSPGFAEVRLLGTAHRAGIRWLEGALGEPLQHRLVRTPYGGLPPALRLMIRAISPRSFRIVDEPDGALDLVAVCRSPRG